MREYRSRTTRLLLFRKTRTRTLFFGDQLSDQAGRGVEFETFRGADLGEDVRLIDWIGSKAAGERLLRVSPEGRALGVLLIARDIPFHQGTGSLTKGDIVFDTSALISADLIENAPDNRLGAVWNKADGGEVLLPPGPGGKWRERILQGLWERTRSPGHGSRPQTGDLMRLRRILPGVTVTVIFADLRNSLHQFSHLALLISFLLHHRKEIVLILVADRWELDLPPVASWYTLRDRSGRGKPFPLGSTKFHEVFERVRGEELAQLLGKLESLRLHRSRHWEIFATGRDPIDSVEAFAASRHRAVYDFGTLKPRTG